VLGGVVAVLAVLLAPALRAYLSQRAQIDALTTQVAGQKATGTALGRQRTAWDDPAYVRAQARDRLKFVMPGEKSYTVIDPKSAAPAAPSPAFVAARTASDHRAWFGDVWRSVEIAGGTVSPTGTK
jgi:cell division protein FtsB